ncbi:hypothetical protein [Idiomarina sp.]|uniref:hypothetical protein n=1 Tax=Idiomarina sp. TaxID=1874361 RepID=UPI0025BEB81B|nr:hypothetical protein [Idiomarina sp.]NQZ03630.1 hypothetical protein [Idiomarina sp.]
MVDVAQDARPTAVVCSMSRSLRLGRKVRWLMSRRMRDVRWMGANAAMVDVAQDARRTVGGGQCRDG